MTLVTVRLILRSGKFFRVVLLLQSKQQFYLLCVHYLFFLKQSKHSLEFPSVSMYLSVSSLFAQPTEYRLLLKQLIYQNSFWIEL